MRTVPPFVAHPRRLVENETDLSRIPRRHRRYRGVALWIAVGITASATLAACGAASSTKQTTHDHVGMVLAPATVAPVVAECSAHLSYTADGNATPLTCARDLNILAWRFYSPLAPKVLSLGPDQSPYKIVKAMCSDIAAHHVTNPEEISAATLASLYYGWHAVTAIGSFDGSQCDQHDANFNVVTGTT